MITLFHLSALRHLSREIHSARVHLFIYIYQRPKQQLRLSMKLWGKVTHTASQPLPLDSPSIAIQQQTENKTEFRFRNQSFWPCLAIAARVFRFDNLRCFAPHHVFAHPQRQPIHLHKLLALFLCYARDPNCEQKKIEMERSESAVLYILGHHTLPHNVHSERFSFASESKTFIIHSTTFVLARLSPELNSNFISILHEKTRTSLGSELFQLFSALPAWTTRAYTIKYLRNDWA